MAEDFPRIPFTQLDLDRLGISRGRLRSALAAQQVRRVTRGTYVVTDLPDSITLRTEIIERTVTPGHVVCDRTAAWLYGVDILLPHEHEVVPTVELCSLRWHRPTGRSEARGRSRDLVASDVTTVSGILVTTPLRTALDLGCLLRRRDALAALDQFRARFDLAQSDLARAALRYRGRRGVVQLRQLIPLSDPRSESVRESWTRLAIVDAGLPAPVPQWEVEEDGLVRWRLDHAYPGQRVAVEYDGHEFHHTDEQLSHDRRRRAWLESHGWTVIVVRRGDFTGPRLERWTDRLRAALASSYSNLRW